MTFSYICYQADEKTLDISQETPKVQNMRNGTNNEEKKQNPAQPTRNQETQLQASRDVRWQMCICLYVVN